MKKYLFQRYRLILIIILSISIIQLMSGCVAELGLEAGSVEGLAEADLIGAEEIAGADEVALLRNAFTENSAGELMLANTESANTLLGRVRLARASGELPKLYFENEAKPFAEVHPESGEFKLIRSGKTYTVADNIFSVEGQSVNIRSSATTLSDIKTTVKHGELLVKLSEKDGWYQVKLVKNSSVYFGWIKANYTLPLVAIVAKNKKEEGSNFKYPDKNRVESDLIGKQINGWYLDSYTKFQDFQIVKEAIISGNLLLTIDFKLKDRTTQSLYNSEIAVTYNKGSYGWVFSNLTSIFYHKVGDNQSHNFSNNDEQHTLNPVMQDNLNIKPDHSDNNEGRTLSTPANSSYTEIGNYMSGNYTFLSNTLVSTQINGQFTIQQNVSCIINRNGVIYGDIILNKNATLIIYGVVTGFIYNRGGEIINHNINNNVRVVDYNNNPEMSARPYNNYIPLVPPHPQIRFIPQSPYRRPYYRHRY